IPVNLLDPVRKNRLREVMVSPEMGNTILDPKVQVASGQQSNPGAPAPVVPAAGTGDLTAASTAPPGGATATDRPDLTYEQQTLALQNIHFQELREKQQQAMREAGNLAAQKDFAGAVEVLQGFLDHLASSEAKLDSGSLALLRRPVDTRKSNYSVLQSQAELDHQVGGAKKKALGNVTQEALKQQNKEKRVSELMASFNRAYRDAKYKEAYQFASLAVEMDPDNSVARTAQMMTKMMIRKAASDALKDEKEKFALEAMVDGERFGPVVNTAD